MEKVKVEQVIWLTDKEPSTVIDDLSTMYYVTLPNGEDTFVFKKDCKIFSGPHK